MNKCHSERRIICKNIISALLSPVILISITTVSFPAQDISMKTYGKPVQTASLDNNLPEPEVNSVPDIDQTRETDLLSAKTHNDQGILYAEKGQYDLAISEFNKALEIAPESAETYNDRGIAYSKNGQYDQAISDFTKALEIKPSDARVYYNRGITYAIKDQYDLALSDLNRSLQIHPGEAALYDVMGSVHVALACLEWKQACKLGNCDHLEEATRIGFCPEAGGNGTLSP